MNRVPQPPTGAPIFPPGLDERGEDVAEDADITRAFVPSGDPFTEDDNLPADPIQETINKAIVTGRPDANWTNTVTDDDLSVEGSPIGGPQAGDYLSHTGARNVAGAMAGLPLGAGGGMALLRALAGRLGAGGRGVADAARTGLGIAQRNPATAAAAGTAGTAPILNQLLRGGGTGGAQARPMGPDLGGG